MSNDYVAQELLKLRDVAHGEALCPRCGSETVKFKPRGAFVAFCMRDLAFLLPHEFSPEALARLCAQ